MANIDILELPVATTLSGEEYFPLVQGGTTKRGQTGLLFADPEEFTEAANTVLAGPTSGADAPVSFRSLVGADIPNALTLGITGTSLGSLGLSGNTSGVVTIKPQAAAGTFNFNLPSTAGTSGYLLTSAGGGSSAMTWTNPSSLAAALSIGVTTITGGVTTRVIYDNAGVVGEYTVSGSGSVAMTTSPVFVTPTLGVASATSLQLGTVSSVTGQLKLANASSGNLTTIQGGNAAAARTYTWPTNFGSAGTVLTDAAGDGTLTWATTPTGALTVGTTPISSGTTTRILYDNAGTLGEYTLAGSGTVVAMATAPTFVTSITAPLAIGGTAVGSTLTLKSTSGVGTTDAIIFQTGNNGTTEGGRFTHDGYLSLGGNASPTYRLELTDTSTIAGRTIAINAQPVVYLPDQSASVFQHSMAIGGGLRSLSHSSASQGQFNLAFGINALVACTTGYQNTIVGTEGAGVLITTAHGMTGMGSNVFAASTTAFDCIAIGPSASQNLVDAYDCTAVGVQALRDGNGHENTGIGGDSGIYRASGNQNVFLGAWASRFLGDNSTHSLTGDLGVYIGYNVHASADGLSNEIVIGSTATGIGSNSVVLGNDSIATTLLKGNVGLGTSTPGYRIDLVGSGNDTTSGGIRVQNSNNAASAAGIISVKSATSSGVFAAYPTNSGDAGVADYVAFAANSDAAGLIIDFPSSGQLLKFRSNAGVSAVFDNLGSCRLGTGALATNATDGFLYVPTCAGTPTGVPTTVTGLAPIIVNTTNNKLYFYSSGVWRDAGP